MYKTTRELKQAASQSLSGKLGLAFGMFFAMALITSPFSLVTAAENGGSFLFSIIGTLLSVILSVGFTSFLLKLCCGQKDQASFADLFYGFKCHPGKAIALYLLMVLYMIPGAIIYAILFGIFAFMAVASAGYGFMEFMYTGLADMSPAVMAGFIVVLVLITLLYMAYALYISTTYGMIYLLLLDYPDLPVKELWKRSALLMKGNRWRYIKLMLSFMANVIVITLLLLLTAVVPVVTMIAMLPYAAYLFYLSIKMQTAAVHFYLDLVQHQGYNKPYSTAADTSYQATGYQTLSDTNMTHDCETAHDNIYDETEKKYTGIDPDTFK